MPCRVINVIYLSYFMVTKSERTFYKIGSNFKKIQTG